MSRTFINCKGLVNGQCDRRAQNLVLDIVRRCDTQRPAPSIELLPVLLDLYQRITLGDPAHKDAVLGEAIGVLKGLHLAKVLPVEWYRAFAGELLALAQCNDLERIL